MKIALEIVKRGNLHLIVSDAHNNKNRNFCLKKTYDFLESYESIDFVNRLKDNSVNLLRGNQLNPFNNDAEREKSKSRDRGFMSKIKRIFK